jgi:UDP-N-acetylmuramoylalanine--D-glutamate ligase
VARGHEVRLADDAPSDAAVELAARLELEIETGRDLTRLLRGVGSVLPTPGLADWHPVFAAAGAIRLPVISEFDLAAQWDDRPIVAITGTNGKTTVTTLVREVLVASGRHAIDAGNTEVPLVEAIDDPAVEVFVVEASSFRLGHSGHFAPDVGCWLNFGPDHLDVHADLAAYETAKSRIWSGQSPDQVAVANADDPLVMSHATGPARVVTYGLGPGGPRSTEGDRPDYFSDATTLRRPDGSVIVEIRDMFRALPHDQSNVLATAACCDPLGATRQGTARALAAFRGLSHRVELVGRRDGISWFDDSKATTPHATAAAVAGFESVVLIAGGRNKGLDLSVLGQLATVRAVVGIGESAREVVAAFGDRPQAVANSMSEAVSEAARLARQGDAVLLSPGCASFDWYRNYSERGDDFLKCVRELVIFGGTET